MIVYRLQVLTPDSDWSNQWFAGKVEAEKAFKQTIEGFDNCDVHLDAVEVPDSRRRAALVDLMNRVHVERSTWPGDVVASRTRKPKLSPKEELLS